METTQQEKTEFEQTEKQFKDALVIAAEHLRCLGWTKAEIRHLITKEI